MKNNLKNLFASKFYLHTWFIGITFALSGFNWIFFVLGAIFVIMQYRFFKPYIDKYGKGEDLDASIAKLEIYQRVRTENLERDYQKQKQGYDFSLNAATAF